MPIAAPAVGDSLPAAMDHGAEDPFFEDVAARKVVAIGMDLAVDRLLKIGSSDEKHLIGKSPLCDIKKPLPLTRLAPRFPFVLIPYEIGDFIIGLFVHPPSRPLDP